MSKKIATLGLRFQSDTITNLSFSNRPALMDYDIIIIFPHSDTKISEITYWKQELYDFMKQGKNIYFFIFPKNNDSLNILPFSFVDNIYKTGSVVHKQQNSVLDKFFETYKDRFAYSMTYSQTSPESQAVFTGTDKTHVLGSILALANKSNFILLPYINIKVATHTYIDSTESTQLIDIIRDIDNQLSTKDTKTPPPEWVQNPMYNSSTETNSINEIETIKNDIQQLEQREEELNMILDKEQEFKGLLFETGKPLENVVIASLHILGYTAENLPMGNNEIDILLNSPEGLIYCGECEGKDKKPVERGKIRQLVDHVMLCEEKLKETNIHGIFFGNGQRLIDLQERTLFFTDNSEQAAEKYKLALIKTPDLYPIVQYLREHDDDAFKKQCRDAIHNGLGGIVQFPNIP